MLHQPLLLNIVECLLCIAFVCVFVSLQMAYADPFVFPKRNRTKRKATNESITEAERESFRAIKRSKTAVVDYVDILPPPVCFLFKL